MNEINLENYEKFLVPSWEANEDTKYLDWDNLVKLLTQQNEAFETRLKVVEQAAREEERVEYLTKVINYILELRQESLKVSVKEFKFYDKMFLFLASIKEFGLERFINS